jgi:uncharacterized CHY-type Zn-finger protein
MGKYDADQSFNDPVLRCTECSKLLFHEEILKVGKCKYCGCRKIRSVEVFNDLELKLMKNKGIDPEYIALFEEVAL